MLINALARQADDFLERIFTRTAARDGIFALVLLSPALFILGTFTLVPFGGALLLSLQQGRYESLHFAGLANYWEVLSSSAFWNSVLVTGYYIAGTVPATLILGFALAYALHRATRLRGFFRTVYFLPYITSIVASAMIWRALFNPEFGLVNHALAHLFIPPQQWLLEPRSVLHLLFPSTVSAGFGPSLALCCVILFDIWHNVGFVIIIFFAGFAALPKEIEDAARIDGAGTRQLIQHVYLPLLTPVMIFLLIVGVAGSFQAFNSFYALTFGGNQTLGSTDTMMIFLFKNFYEYGRWGYGSTVAVLLSGMIAVLSALQWRLARNRIYSA